MERSDPAAIASLHYGRGQSAGSAILSHTGQRDLLVAADFDKSTWREDVAAFLAACKAHGVPAALERSRSGQGGHVWIFFAEPVPAFLARRPGGASRHRGEGKIVPAGGFGNLIAPLLQHSPRFSGSSLFVDANFEPLAD